MAYNIFALIIELEFPLGNPGPTTGYITSRIWTNLFLIGVEKNRDLFVLTQNFYQT